MYVLLHTHVHMYSTTYMYIILGVKEIFLLTRGTPSVQQMSWNIQYIYFNFKVLNGDHVPWYNKYMAESHFLLL